MSACVCVCVCVWIQCALSTPAGPAGGGALFTDDSTNGGCYVLRTRSLSDHGATVSVLRSSRASCTTARAACRVRALGKCRAGRRAPPPRRASCGRTHVSPVVPGTGDSRLQVTTRWHQQHRWAPHAPRPADQAARRRSARRHRARRGARHASPEYQSSRARTQACKHNAGPAPFRSSSTAPGFTGNTLARQNRLIWRTNSSAACVPQSPELMPHA